MEGVDRGAWCLTLLMSGCRSTTSRIFIGHNPRRIGHVKSVDMNPSRVYEGNYVRVRAKIALA